MIDTTIDILSSGSGSKKSPGWVGGTRQCLIVNGQVLFNVTCWRFQINEAEANNFDRLFDFVEVIGSSILKQNKDNHCEATPK